MGSAAQIEVVAVRHSFRDAVGRGNGIADMNSTPGRFLKACARRMRQTLPVCCARAASSNAAAAPPIAASNSRRPMVTVMRLSRPRCVNRRIPCHECAALTARYPARARRTSGTGCNERRPAHHSDLISEDYFRPGRFTSSGPEGRGCRARFSLRATRPVQ